MGKYQIEVHRKTFSPRVGNKRGGIMYQFLGWLEDDDHINVVREKAKIYPNFLEARKIIDESNSKFRELRIVPMETNE